MKVVFVVIFLFSLELTAQIYNQNVLSPRQSDFESIQQFLSSDWMEGREVGKRGSFIAADYIASMMKLFKLEPYSKNKRQSYFQDFGILQFKNESSNLALININNQIASKLTFTESIDYQSFSFPRNIETEASVIFCGYGISTPELAYDDYNGIDSKGKIVVCVNGFPGSKDSLSKGWKKFSKVFGDEEYLYEYKQNIARKHGALALILIKTDSEMITAASNQDLVNSSMNSEKITEQEYQDNDYLNLSDSLLLAIPCFTVNVNTAQQILSGTGISINDFEKRNLSLPTPNSVVLKDRRISISILPKKKIITGRNILGMIEGTDKTKNIIIGAHYDHLGIRENRIYNGSDDNASGVAGVLALAKNWAESAIKPPCNIIFAAWTGEEKGHLGSRYFSGNSNSETKDILLCINMDMISRSESTDTLLRKLWIGTRPVDKQFRDMAIKINNSLPFPFELDLWDVTGAYGSDYAAFRDMNIPVLTFFSGFHNDYHTPMDISVRSDLKKMENILDFVNEFIKRFLENIH